jgi:phytoene dehydrogenase-like protein
MKGSTHGLCHNLAQLAYFRSDNHQRDYHNLYFVGASTRPGTGMQTVMVSGRQSAQQIMDDFSRRN